MGPHKFPAHVFPKVYLGLLWRLGCAGAAHQSLGAPQRGERSGKPSINGGKAWEIHWKICEHQCEIGEIWDNQANCFEKIMMEIMDISCP